jgi:myb proto-oncogene protein
MMRTATKRSALKSSLDEAEEYEDPLLDDDDGAPNAKRRPWNPDEDEQLRSLVDQYGIKSWAQIATNLTNRNGKQCRERWRNHLRPQLNKGEWSVQEDIDIWDKVQEMGTKWAQISELYMSQRTDNDIKNRWNSIIRKQQHPAGRDWLPEENEARAVILGSASRTLAGKKQPATSSEDGVTQPPRKRPRQVPRLQGNGASGPRAASFDGSGDGMGSAVAARLSSGEEDSPQPGRKLFGSPVLGEDGDVDVEPEPMQLSGFEAEQAAAAVAEEFGRQMGGKAKAAADAAEAEARAADAEIEFSPGGQAEACRMLVGGEISADNFDVDAFLPLANATVASPSQISSPVGSSKVRSRLQSRLQSRPNLASNLASQVRPISRLGAPSAGSVLFGNTTSAPEWYDQDLDTSLSPILTPSLRHQLRALIGGTKSPHGRSPHGRSPLTAALLESLARTPGSSSAAAAAAAVAAAIAAGGSASAAAPAAAAPAAAAPAAAANAATSVPVPVTTPSAGRASHLLGAINGVSCAITGAVSSAFNVAALNLARGSSSNSYSPSAMAAAATAAAAAAAPASSGASTAAATAAAAAAAAAAAHAAATAANSPAPLATLTNVVSLSGHVPMATATAMPILPAPGLVLPPAPPMSSA